MSAPQKMIVVSRKALTTAVLALFISFSVPTAVAILYTNYVDRQSNQAWCDIIDGLDKRYSALPPTADPDAKIFATQIKALKKKYEC